jgi:uncharacterized protein
MRYVLLLFAGTLAGVVGSAGGIMSLVSYPALLATGLGPLTATITNNVVAAAVMPGSVLGSRGELKGRSVFLRECLPAAAVGGAAGAALLLLTPANVFAKIVPFLVAAGALALLAQPYLTSWHQRRERNEKLVFAIGLVAVAFYAGYFGAGAGIMMLTLVLVLVDQHLPKANALKNMLVGIPSLVTALAMTIFGNVDWAFALPLMVGVFLGASIGPEVARRVPQELLRWLIVILGLALAVKLWVSP